MKQETITTKNFYFGVEIVGPPANVDKVVSILHAVSVLGRGHEDVRDEALSILEGLMKKQPQDTENPTKRTFLPTRMK